MSLHVHRVAYPVTVLGPGHRLGLWVQGCNIHCPGCISQDMWDVDAGYDVAVDEFASELGALCIEQHLDGLSISGGEPTEQADDLAYLIKLLRDFLACHGADIANDFNVLAFSGRTIKTVKRNAASLWDVCDAMVCGPYRENRPRGDALRASDNQVLICKTEKFRDTYRTYAQSDRHSLQINVNDQEITMTGMPDAGALDIIEEKLLEKGVVLKGLSWRK